MNKKGLKPVRVYNFFENNIYPKIYYHNLLTNMKILIITFIFVEIKEDDVKQLFS